MLKIQSRPNFGILVLFPTATLGGNTIPVTIQMSQEMFPVGAVSFAEQQKCVETML